MPIVNHTVQHPDGSGAQYASVVIRLIASETVGTEAPGYSGSAGILGTTVPALTSDGVWSVPLTANSLIIPAGTVYQITTQIPGRPIVIEYILVPDGVGPYDVTDLLTDPPATISNSALETHALTPHGGVLVVKDEGSVVVPSATSFDFVGTGITVTGVAGAATVTFTGGGGVFDVGNYGGVLDGVADDTAAFAAAVAAAVNGGTVTWAGVMKLTAWPTWAANVQLVGKGKRASRILMDAATTATTFAGIQGSLGSTLATVALDVLPGATSFVTSVDVSGSLTAGDLVFLKNPGLYNLKGFKSTYQRGELIEIASVSGTTVNLRGFVHGTYRAADGTISIKKVNTLDGVELRDFTISNANPGTGPGLGIGGSGDDYRTCGAFLLAWCRSPIVDNVAIEGMDGQGISVKSCWRPVIKVDCRDFTSTATTDPVSTLTGIGQFGYGINLTGATKFGDFVVFADNVRHGFTADGNTTDGISYINLVHDSIVANGKASNFDAHPGAQGLTFADCVSTGAPQGHFGFQVRSRDVHLIDCVSRDDYGAVSFDIAEHCSIKGGTLSFGRQPNGGAAIVVREGCHYIDIDDVLIRGNPGAAIGLIGSNDASGTYATTIDSILVKGVTAIGLGNTGTQDRAFMQIDAPVTVASNLSIIDCILIDPVGDITDDSEVVGNHRSFFRVSAATVTGDVVLDNVRYSGAFASGLVELGASAFVVRYGRNFNLATALETYIASSVTIGPITGLLATDVQAALAELKVLIDNVGSAQPNVYVDLYADSY